MGKIETEREKDFKRKRIFKGERENMQGRKKDLKRKREREWKRFVRLDLQSFPFFVSVFYKVNYLTFSSSSFSLSFLFFLIPMTLWEKKNWSGFHSFGLTIQYIRIKLQQRSNSLFSLSSLLFCFGRKKERGKDRKKRNRERRENAIKCLFILFCCNKHTIYIPLFLSFSLFPSLASFFFSFFFFYSLFSFFSLTFFLS